MLLNKATEREWKPTDYPGIERSLFRLGSTREDWSFGDGIAQYLVLPREEWK